VFGGYIGGRLAGLTSSESWVMGFGMNGRGVMELVIADLALKRGFISTDVFSTLVLMGMVTTIMTPTLLKWAFERVEALAFERAEALAAAEVAPAVAAPAMAAAFQPDVPEDLITNLPYRRAWARNASGTETDAGAGSRLFRRARGVDRRHRPSRREVDQRITQGEAPSVARPFSADLPGRGWMGVAVIVGGVSVGLRLLLKARRAQPIYPRLAV
ncbi:MAG: hypothetical protein DMF89_15770, partial [Acidobacteria bacterium]